MLATLRHKGGRLRGKYVEEGRVLRAAPAGGVIGWEALDKIVRAALPPIPGAALVQYGDSDYYLPTRDEVDALVSSSGGANRTWTRERFDCDDFAFVLKGDACLHAYAADGIEFALAVGMIWADFTWVNEFHAVNWFVDPAGTFWLIEPQGGAVYAAGECKGNVGLVVL